MADDPPPPPQHFSRKNEQHGALISPDIGASRPREPSAAPSAAPAPNWDDEYRKAFPVPDPRPWYGRPAFAISVLVAFIAVLIAVAWWWLSR
jgi:hypothetical protein